MRVLGKAVVDNIRRFISCIREVHVAGRRMSSEDVERCSVAIEQLNDVVKGVMLSLADVLDARTPGDPRAVFMRFLSIVFDVHRELCARMKKYCLGIA